jgi:hypothetical protein
MLRRNLQLLSAQKWNVLVASRGLCMEARTSAVVEETLTLAGKPQYARQVFFSGA